MSQMLLRFPISFSFAICFVLYAQPVCAQNETVLDVKLTEPQALGQVTGPETLGHADESGLVLARHGRPRYLNVSYDPVMGKALMFDGTASYRHKGVLPELPTGFVLEVWCRATNPSQPGLHGVVAIGDGAHGCSLVQKDSDWGVFVGGLGFIPAGKVEAEVWTHLALVMPAKGPGGLYLNGLECQRSVPRVDKRTPLFTIGDMGHDNEFFRGDIAHVRLSTINSKGFDPKTRLLVDFTKAQRARRETRAEARERLTSILRELPRAQSTALRRYDADWMIRRCTQQSQLQVTVAEDKQSADLVLGNGLVARRFRLGENLVCYSHERGGQKLLRSINPEAVLVVEGGSVLVSGMRFPSMASGQKGRSHSPAHNHRALATRGLDSACFCDEFRSMSPWRRRRASQIVHTNRQRHII